MERMGLIQQKRPLYRQLIALLCIPPMGAGLVFFSPLSHTISTFPFSCMLVRSLSFCYTPFITSTPAIEPVSAFYTLSLVVPLFSLTYCTCNVFSFSIAQLKCVGTLQQFAGAFSVLARVQCKKSVLFLLLLLSYLTTTACILMKG